MAALPEPPPPPMMVPSIASASAARRPQRLETAQLRQEAPPRDGAQGRREERKAHESREALQEKEVASHQGREGVEAARAGLDEARVPGEAGAAGAARRAAAGAAADAPSADASGPGSAVAGPALIATAWRTGAALAAPVSFPRPCARGRLSSDASGIARRNRNRRGGHRHRRSAASPDRAADRAAARPPMLRTGQMHRLVEVMKISSALAASNRSRSASRQSMPSSPHNSIHGLAADPRQYPALVRGQHRAVAHDEDVAADALGEMALRVEQHRPGFLVLRLGFEIGGDQVQVVVRLGARAQHVGRRRGGSAARRCRCRRGTAGPAPSAAAGCIRR